MKREHNTDEERWALGSSLDSDEQRYVLERFPESRRTLGLTETEWLAQMSFRLNRSGTLDLRAITCRLPVAAGEEPRFHRVPRGKEWPTPEPPRRQQRQREPQQQQLPPAVRPIAEEALATGDLATANEGLHRLSGGKAIQQVAADWAGQVQSPAEPEQREQQQPPQPDPQLRPTEPRPSPSDGGRSYTQRVYQAYRDLAKEYRSPDVRIDALHGRLGGSLQDLHRWLRQACRDHLAVPSRGEPALADHAARQSALRLPGQKESFLNVKLLELPAAIPSAEIAAGAGIFHLVVASMADNQQPRIAINLTATQARLLAEAIQHGSQQAELQTLEQELRAFADRPHEYVQEHKPSDLERYERALRVSAALRYPVSDRTPELEARIEKTIQRRLGEFRQEQHVRQYEACLRRTIAARHPNLTPDEAQRYERRINELVTEFRQNQVPQQQTPTPAARSQAQGRGIER